MDRKTHADSPLAAGRWPLHASVHGPW